MFDIKYLLTTEGVEEIVNTTPYEFDNEFSEITGQIKLSFGSKSYGVCDERYTYSPELLLNWFNLLNSIIKI